MKFLGRIMRFFFILAILSSCSKDTNVMMQEMFSNVPSVPSETYENPDDNEEYNIIHQPETAKENAESVDGDVEEGVVEAVIDGDTILLTTGEKVRLIGVDTPESVHSDESKNTPFGVEASEYTKSLLKSGDKIYLTKDVNDTDKYDRLLRVVWFEKPNDRWSEEELRKSLNGKLLLDGYATVLIIDDKSYAQSLYKFQGEAMNDKRGLWANSDFWEYIGIV